MASTVATVARSVERCGQKRFFSTFASAKRVAKWTHQTTDDPTRPYACTVCGGFHIGKLLEDSRNARLDTARTRRQEPTVEEQLAEHGLDLVLVYRPK